MTISEQGWCRPDRRFAGRSEWRYALPLALHSRGQLSGAEAGRRRCSDRSGRAAPRLPATTAQRASHGTGCNGPFRRLRNGPRRRSINADVAQAHGEPEVRPYRLLNDLRRETIPAVAAPWRYADGVQRPEPTDATFSGILTFQPGWRLTQINARAVRASQSKRPLWMAVNERASPRSRGNVSHATRASW